MVEKVEKTQSSKKEKCFVIMPFSDSGEYASGHFSRVYNYIFKPAIEKAGYIPHRIDAEKSSNLIQERIVRELIEAPMVLCDLSSRNPNVLFELGIRQAFDKPVVLVKDELSERIFDISGLSTIEYRKSCIIDEAQEDINRISEAIKETKKDNHFNSLIRLINTSPATLSKGKEIEDNQYTDYMLKKIYSMVDKLQDSINYSRTENQEPVDIVQKEIEYKSRYQKINKKINDAQLDVHELFECKNEVANLLNRLKKEFVADPFFQEAYSKQLERCQDRIDSLLIKKMQQ